jgi:hypothetical protein
MRAVSSRSSFGCSAARLYIVSTRFAYVACSSRAVRVTRSGESNSSGSIEQHGLGPGALHPDSVVACPAIAMAGAAVLRSVDPDVERAARGASEQAAQEVLGPPDWLARGEILA